MNLTFVGRTGAVITGSRTSRVFTITGSSNIVFDGLTFSALSFSSTSVDSVISASSSNVDIKNSEFKNRIFLIFNIYIIFSILKFHDVMVYNVFVLNGAIEQRARIFLQYHTLKTHPPILKFPVCLPVSPGRF